MIAYLRGSILSKGKDHAIIIVGDIGYKVYIPGPTLDPLAIGSTTTLYTHDHIREDARDLFGFTDAADLTLFEKLISVSGVGPKMAMTVLALGSNRVRDAIAKGDVGTLTSASGVGKKTAQKIVLDLKGVLSEQGVTTADMDAVEALRRLGYSATEARDALTLVTGATSEEKIKEALKILGKH